MCDVIHYDFHHLTSEYYYAHTNLRVYERMFVVPRRSTWVKEGLEILLPPKARGLGGPVSTRIWNSKDWKDEYGRYFCRKSKQPDNPVITHVLVRPRLWAVQRVFERGLVVVMVDATLLYDQSSHRSEAIWQEENPGCLECTEHFQTLRHWPLDARLMSYIEAASFGALIRVQWLRLDKPLITSLVERWRSETNTFHLANGEMTITLEDVGILLGLCVNGFAVTGSTWGATITSMDLGESPRGSHDVLDAVRGLPDYREVQLGVGRHLPSSIENSRRRVALEWSALLDFSHFYRWNVRRTNADNPCGKLVLYKIEMNHQRSYQAQEDNIVIDRCAHTTRHALSEYMAWYLPVTRRFISPPLMEPAMVYHARGYTEEALLGYVRNMIERVQCAEGVDPSLAVPYMMEIGNYYQSILHSLLLLDGTIIEAD
ncbi:hypothetical protein H6P81_016240 [Aristolochia fimbriata]|uniref:Aminotransferase-like plant mobile domain-containing protein n=1 Tax=Aristolochia fimbriata TaxID=158543 RepID=A0AAV7E7P0_ARIFI|nr:hypothetical protein H6P81_016240 [Aristolochia fimbriata]